MHEEISEKVIGVSVRAVKITADILAKALEKVIAELENSGKQLMTPGVKRGKQTMRRLAAQNAGLSNIEITAQNIKAFERTARKYGIDYALKKDAAEIPPRYLVFFKGRDVDALTAAFKEFTARQVKQAKKPSVQKLLESMKDIAARHNAHREKTKSKDRGQEL